MTIFVALDGEGQTREDGSHDYVTLQCSDGTLIEDWNVGGLGTLRCFDYLLERGVQNPGAIFIGFSFGYDTNMMLRDIKRTTLKRLHENNSADWIPSQGVRYYINYIQNKWLGLSKFHYVNGAWKRQNTIKVWDVFGFFQMSFVKALPDWNVGADSQEFIETMKLKRGNFAAEDAEEIKRYCFEECKFLVELGNRLQESLDDAEIELKQWHGAGAIAQTLLNQHKASTYLQRKPDTGVTAHDETIYDCILRAYYGGRIETFATGLVGQTIYDYDINSAYPNAIRRLPNMDDSTWKRVGTYDPSAPFAIWRVAWELEEGQRIAPFPYRHKSNIYYLKKGEGWYHAPEVLAAYKAGYRLTISDGFILCPKDDSKPFEWVEAIYEERQRAKQRGDKREKVLKLGLNSLYGKFAQSSGPKHKPGKYQSFYYAGYITSFCRSMLLEAASQAPGDIIAFATDGILSLKKLDLDFGKNLGQWEAKTEVSDGLLVIQPGLVISRHESFVRTRGVDRSSVGFDTFNSAWASRGITAKVVATDTRFHTLGRSLASSYDTTSLNQTWRRWTKQQTEIAFFPQRKWPAMTPQAWTPNGGFIWLELREGFDGLSELYEKGIEIDNLDAEPVDYVDSLDVED